MPTLTLIAAGDPFETALAEAEASVRASFITDYLAASGDPIDQAWITYEIEQYDAANPEQPPLMDEIRSLSLPAAA